MKTKHDFIVDYLFEENGHFSQHEYDLINAGVEFAQRFIPIEKELPPIHVDVILKCESGFIDKGCLIHQSGDNMFSSSSGDLDIVTHWRPISFL
jgi:hypothetical protein